MYNFLKQNTIREYFCFNKYKVVTVLLSYLYGVIISGKSKLTCGIVDLRAAMCKPQ